MDDDDFPVNTVTDTQEQPRRERRTRSTRTRAYEGDNASETSERSERSNRIDRRERSETRERSVRRERSENREKRERTEKRDADDTLERRERSERSRRSDRQDNASETRTERRERKERAIRLEKFEESEDSKEPKPVDTSERVERSERRRRNDGESKKRDKEDSETSIAADSEERERRRAERRERRTRTERKEGREDIADTRSEARSESRSERSGRTERSERRAKRETATETSERSKLDEARRERRRRREAADEANPLREKDTENTSTTNIFDTIQERRKRAERADIEEDRIASQLLDTLEESKQSTFRRRRRYAKEAKLRRELSKSGNYSDKDGEEVFKNHDGTTVRILRNETDQYEEEPKRVRRRRTPKPEPVEEKPKVKTPKKEPVVEENKEIESNDTQSQEELFTKKSPPADVVVEPEVVKEVESEVDGGKLQSLMDPRSKVIETSQKHTKFTEDVEAKINNELTRPVLNLTVHHTDLLRLHSDLVHPYIRVTTIDTATGQLLMKHDNERSAVANIESFGKNSTCDYIIPTMIPPYNMRQQNSLLPKWESSLFFDQDYDYFLQPNVIIVFEIFDYDTKNPSKYIRTEGVRKVAWAFLHLLSVSGRSNTEKRVRLQLYKYPSNPLTSLLGVNLGADKTVGNYESYPYADVINLYRLKSKKKYPSTLHVTIAARSRPEEEIVSTRPQHQLQTEVGSLSYDEMCRMYASHWMIEDTEETILDERENKRLVRRMNALRRTEKEKCTIPTSLLFQLEAGVYGCLSLAFSKSNEYLACGCANANSTSTLKVYNVFTGKLSAEYEGHLSSLLYSIDFSNNDKLIATGSGDSTARIWTFSKKKRLLYTIQHPAYVYAVKFHPKFESYAKSKLQVDNLLVTGSFDHKIRFFALSSSGDFQPILIKELSLHTSRVNSLSFDPSGLRLFTADGSGLINVLSARIEMEGEPLDEEASSPVSSSRSSQDNRTDSLGGYVVDITTLSKVLDNTTMSQLKAWIQSETLFSCIKTVKNNELRKSSLTIVRNDPRNGENRLLAHSQDNMIRLIDLNSQSILKRFSGVKCHINSQKSQISPDGRYIISGSNSGKVFVWSKEGQKLMYPEGLEYGFVNPVFDIAWASEYHIVALCSYGNPEPVRIYSIPFNEEEENEPVIENRSLLDIGKKFWGKYKKTVTKE